MDCPPLRTIDEAIRFLEEAEEDGALNVALVDGGWRTKTDPPRFCAGAFQLGSGVDCVASYAIEEINDLMEAAGSKQNQSSNAEIFSWILGILALTQEEASPMRPAVPGKPIIVICDQTSKIPNLASFLRLRGAPKKGPEGPQAENFCELAKLAIVSCITLTNQPVLIMHRKIVQRILMSFDDEGNTTLSSLKRRLGPKFGTEHKWRPDAAISSRLTHHPDISPDRYEADTKIRELFQNWHQAWKSGRLETGRLSISALLSAGDHLAQFTLAVETLPSWSQEPAFPGASASSSSAGGPTETVEIAPELESFTWERDMLKDAVLAPILARQDSLTTLEPFLRRAVERASNELGQTRTFEMRRGRKGAGNHLNSFTLHVKCPVMRGQRRERKGFLEIRLTKYRETRVKRDLHFAIQAYCIDDYFSHKVLDHALEALREQTLRREERAMRQAGPETPMPAYPTPSAGSSEAAALPAPQPKATPRPRLPPPPPPPPLSPPRRAAGSDRPPWPSPEMARRVPSQDSPRTPPRPPPPPPQFPKSMPPPQLPGERRLGMGPAFIGSFAPLPQGWQVHMQDRGGETFYYVWDQINRRSWYPTKDPHRPGTYFWRTSDFSERLDNPPWTYPRR